MRPYFLPDGSNPIFDAVLRRAVEEIAGECQEYRAIPVVTLALSLPPNNMLYSIISSSTPLPLLERVLREALATAVGWGEAEAHGEGGK